jgi:hypothetical protein
MKSGKLNKAFLLLGCLFLLDLFPAGIAAGNTTPVNINLPTDTSKVIAKNFLPVVFKTYRTDKDFIYIKSQPLIHSFWGKLLDKIAQIFQFTTHTKIFPILFYLIFFAVFVVLIVLLIGGDFQTILSRTKHLPGSVNTYIEENIGIADYDQLISQEIENGNLNLAVRYLYLQLLQTLSRHQIIHWQKDKTNREYVRELSQSDFYLDFKSVTHTYEYVWYGKFQLTMQVFCSVRDSVYQLIRQING